MRRKQEQQGFAVIETVLLVVIIGIIGFVVWFVLHSRQQANQTLPPPKSTARPAVITDNWTGKGLSANWSDAANWSQGVPKTGENLTFNLSEIPLSASGLAERLTNDIAGLKLHTLTITGTGNGGFTLGGNALTLTGDINDQAVRSSGSNPASIQVRIENDLSFTGSSHITLGAKAGNLTLGGKNTTFSVSGTPLAISNTGDGTLEEDAALKGPGQISITNTGTGGVYFHDSPNLSGSVQIQHGLVSTTPNAFGSSRVEVSNGAAWEVNQTVSTTATVTNDMTLSGDGVQSNGVARTGAFSACLTAAEQGCGTTETVTLTGGVFLSGDAQIGASNSQGSQAFHVNYILKNVNQNGHKLTVVKNYRMTEEF